MALALDVVALRRLDVDVAFQLSVVIVLLVLAAVPGRPRHLVLLLQAPPCIGEPRGDLGQRHLGDDGEHDLLAFGWVRVLTVLVEPRLQCRRGIPCGVLSVGGVSVHVWPQRPERVEVQRGGDT